MALPVDERARRGAGIIETSFCNYRSEYHRFTERARERFEHRDWLGALQDSADRLGIYTKMVRAGVDALTALLENDLRDKPTWRAMKPLYHERVVSRPDGELAETFFNSFTRRIFTTVGVDPDIEFVFTPAREAPAVRPEDITVTFAGDGDADVEPLFTRVLAHYALGIGYEDLDRDARRMAIALRRALAGARLERLEFIKSIFFRNKGAYLVGRAVTSDGQLPVVIALLNVNGRVSVDAVLFTEDEVSIVFSFTRSYFFVETDCPAAVVAFLAAIMPRKPIAELYNAIGHNKHGKTTSYRALLHHLATTDDQFEIAPGARGMVMLVFTLPSYDVVFKVIRDRFDAPKTTTRQDVRAKYGLVFRHDRAGRLADAQEFEHLQFERRRFSAPLMDALTAQAAETVRVDGDYVDIRHLYTERRMVPLDIYLREASPGDARAAVLDYGQAVKDLAASNIFPGDLLLKNFGVTRHRRLVFYDYDELCLVTDCRFRRLPPPRDDADELSSEPWFFVGEQDVFPEEFLPFLGLQGDLRRVFLDAHGDLLTPDYWCAMQEEHRAGHVLDVLPYPVERRLALVEDDSASPLPRSAAQDRSAS